MKRKPTEDQIRRYLSKHPDTNTTDWESLACSWVTGRSVRQTPELIAACRAAATEQGYRLVVAVPAHDGGVIEVWRGRTGIVLRLRISPASKETEPVEDEGYPLQA